MTAGKEFPGFPLGDTLRTGRKLWARDCVGDWHWAVVRSVGLTEACVHFEGWSTQSNERILLESARLRERDRTAPPTAAPPAAPPAAPIAPTAPTAADVKLAISAFELAKADSKTAQQYALASAQLAQRLVSSEKPFRLLQRLPYEQALAQAEREADAAEAAAAAADTYAKAAAVYATKAKEAKEAYEARESEGGEVAPALRR